MPSRDFRTWLNSKEFGDWHLGRTTNKASYFVRSALKLHWFKDNESHNHRAPRPGYLEIESFYRKFPVGGRTVGLFARTVRFVRYLRFLTVSHQAILCAVRKRAFVSDVSFRVSKKKKKQKSKWGRREEENLRILLLRWILRELHIILKLFIQMSIPNNVYCKKVIRANVLIKWSATYNLKVLHEYYARKKKEIKIIKSSANRIHNDETVRGRRYRSTIHFN